LVVALEMVVGWVRVVGAAVKGEAKVMGLVEGVKVTEAAVMVEEMGKVAGTEMVVVPGSCIHCCTHHHLVHCLHVSQQAAQVCSSSPSTAHDGVLTCT
jgi:hypothetical protein